MAGEGNDRQAEDAARQAPRRTHRAAGHAGRAFHHFLHFCMGLSLVLLVVAGLIWLRLAQGPVHLPFVANAAEDLFNAGSDRLQAEVGDVVLRLGEKGAPAGIQFRDVRLSYKSGEPLFRIPRLAARFDVSDLLHGRLRPIEVTVIRPEARLVRMVDGTFRFGLGELANDTPPETPAGPNAMSAGPASPAQAAAVSRLLDSLAGDAEPIPELSRLRQVAIRDARLVFENLRAGRRWTTQQADLRAWQAPDGLRLRIEIGLADAGEPGARLVLTGERLRGSGGITHLEMRFRDLRPEHLAEQIEQVKWLRLFDARLDGNLAMALHPDGRIEGVEGRITAGAGRIAALDEGGKPFDSVALAFAYEPGRERMRVTEFTLAAPAANIRLAGFADLVRGPRGLVTGLAGQFEVAELRADLPEVFADPISFDSGQIVARLDLDPVRIEVASSHLRADALVVEVAGTAEAGADGWTTDMRASGQNMSVAQLVRFWPHVAAGDARRWVQQNIRAGLVDRFVAQIRFSGGTPRLELDFTYSDLEASYLGAMTPIVAARGRGTLTLDHFDLAMESGEVRVAEGAPVRLDGSVMRIPDLETKPTLADITLHGRGATSSVLALIDEAPLRLTSKLGLEPASVGGEARVTAALGFPLIDELGLDMVDVAADATLENLALPFRLPGGHVADIRGREVALSAGAQEMHVAGPMRVDGTPMNIIWDEHYGRGAGHRDIAIDGAVTPDFLERLNLGTEYFTGGTAPIRLKLSQSGGADLAFDLDADLGPALIEVATFDWRKPPGQAGHLTARGSFADGIRAPAFRLETDELKAEGAIAIDQEGRMESADVDRLRFRGLADVSLRARRRQDGGLTLKLGGRRLDLSLFEDGSSEDSAVEHDASGGRPETLMPLDVDYGLGEMQITRKLAASPAAGTYLRTAEGHATASLEGSLVGQVPFTAEYEKASGTPASVMVRSREAGAFLAAAGLFGGAKGGALRLTAELAPEKGVEMSGAAQIKDVRIQTGGTFRSILKEGGAEEAAKAAETGGLAFDRVDVPFEYRDGVMVLGESLARGNMLAVKVEGTVDENTDALDLVGVISPAYGLTGAFDSIPLLGAILSGGKGEGIVAMTFSVKGTMEKPDFSVNPLSLLAPGFLRKIFSGRTAEPDPRFLEQLERNRD